MASLSLSNWDNLASVDDIENRFAENSLRVVIQTILSEEKAGPDFDWVSKPDILPGDGQNFVYNALDRDILWRIVTKF